MLLILYSIVIPEPARGARKHRYKDRVARKVGPSDPTVGAYTLYLSFFLSVYSRAVRLNPEFSPQSYTRETRISREPSELYKQGGENGVKCV